MNTEHDTSPLEQVRSTGMSRRANRGAQQACGHAMQVGNLIVRKFYAPALPYLLRSNGQTTKMVHPSPIGVPKPPFGRLNLPCNSGVCIYEVTYCPKLFIGRKRRYSSHCCAGDRSRTVLGEPSRSIHVWTTLAFFEFIPGTSFSPEWEIDTGKMVSVGYMFTKFEA